MNDLTVFNFESQPIRTYADENGDTWFCFRDVAKVLEISNLSYLKKRLNEKGCRLTSTLTKGGKQSLIFVNEGNLYRMTCRSDKPQAKPFENWVYDEVLPSIRKTGSYTVANKEKSSTNIDEIKKAIVLALRKNSAPLSFKINGEVISVPEPVYKGIHTGLLQLDPIMHNLSKVIEGACRKAVREELKRIIMS
jgi:prophage antirepressor-like protein